MLNLRAAADAIPELGHGGRVIADELVRLAAGVRAGESIVDIGPYLGSTTAYLALGAPSGTPIHAFDTWDSDICDLKRKAKQFHRMTLPDDLLPMYLENLEPFGMNLAVHRVDMNDSVWNDGPIGLLVDDIGVEPGPAAAKMAAFGPHLVPGAKIALLDYFWFETKRAPQFTGQRDYFAARADRYRFVKRLGKVAALFEVVP